MLKYLSFLNIYPGFFQRLQLDIFYNKYLAIIFCDNQCHVVSEHLRLLTKALHYRNLAPKFFHVNKDQEYISSNDLVIHALVIHSTRYPVWCSDGKYQSCVALCKEHSLTAM